MNVCKLSGTDAAARLAQTQRLSARRQSPAAATAVPARRYDRLEKQFDELREAAEAGYIEAGGNRFAVTEEMSADLRQGFEQMRARGEGIAARLTAALSARLDKQRTEEARMDGKSMQRASEIARRISEGGEVPSEDEYFLMTFSRELYQSAKLMAATKTEEKEYDTVFDDGELARMEAERILAELRTEMGGDAPIPETREE